MDVAVGRTTGSAASRRVLAGHGGIVPRYRERTSTRRHDDAFENGHVAFPARRRTHPNRSKENANRSKENADGTSTVPSIGTVPQAEASEAVNSVDQRTQLPDH
jgi:hypothetical protein